MKENLKTTKYNDGTTIPHITDNSEWAALTMGAYCDYNNTLSNSTTYGRLYNWYAVNTGKLCPTGWHIPTRDEWTTLTTYLGGENVAGGKLKETGTTHWLDPNTGATNETGFTALPGGYRNLNGAYTTVGHYSDWWSSTEVSTKDARYRGMGYYYADVFRNDDSKHSGFSVRCLKDN